MPDGSLQLTMLGDLPDQLLLQPSRVYDNQRVGKFSAHRHACYRANKSCESIVRHAGGRGGDALHSQPLPWDVREPRLRSRLGHHSL